jgi:hypothetical protein
MAEGEWRLDLSSHHCTVVAPPPSPKAHSYIVTMPPTTVSPVPFVPIETNLASDRNELERSGRKRSESGLASSNRLKVWMVFLCFAKTG